MTSRKKIDNINSVRTFAKQLNNPTGQIATLASMCPPYDYIKRQLIFYFHNFEQNRWIKEICIEYCKLDIKMISALMSGISKNITIQILKIEYNQIDSDGANHIAQGIAANLTLRELFIGHNPIGSIGITCIARALRYNTSLIILNAPNNNIGDSGAIELSKMLFHNLTLQHLNLGYNKINKNGAKNMSDSLRNSPLISLDLCCNNFGEPGINFIGTALQYNTSLKTLDISNNYTISEGSGGLFFSRLGYNTSLITLKYNNNELGLNADSLKKINVSKLYLTNVSCANIESASEELLNNPKLTLLALNQNEIFGNNIFKDFGYNDNLIVLTLSSCKININGIKLLCTALKINTTLERLFLSKTTIDTDKLIIISEMLHINTTLIYLDLSCNDVNHHGIQALSNALLINKSLTSLCLNYNMLNDDSKSILAEALKTNITLLYLPIQEYNTVDITFHNIIKTLIQRNMSLYNNEFIKFPLLNKVQKIMISVLLFNNSEHNLLPRLPDYIFFEILQFWQNKHF